MASGPIATSAADNDDRRKAQVFFRRGRSLAEAGQFEYAIEMFLQGLLIDPEHIAAHQELRAVSLQRMAAGGKARVLNAMNRPSRDEKQAMYHAEMLFAYDPVNVEHMQAVADAAERAGYDSVVDWIRPILREAQRDCGGTDERQ